MKGELQDHSLTILFTATVVSTLALCPHRRAMVGIDWPERVAIRGFAVLVGILAGIAVSLLFSGAS
jgi:hypothetical protein